MVSQDTLKLGGAMVGDTWRENAAGSSEAIASAGGQQPLRLRPTERTLTSRFNGLCRSRISDSDDGEGGDDGWMDDEEDEEATFGPGCPLYRLTGCGMLPKLYF